MTDADHGDTRYIPGMMIRTTDRDEIVVEIAVAYRIIDGHLLIFDTDDESEEFPIMTFNKRHWVSVEGYPSDDEDA